MVVSECPIEYIYIYTYVFVILLQLVVLVVVVVVLIGEFFPPRIWFCTPICAGAAKIFDVRLSIPSALSGMMSAVFVSFHTRAVWIYALFCYKKRNRNQDNARPP